MIRALILRQIARAEKELGESLDYVRHIARVSLPAFLRFSRFIAVARYRRRLPLEPYHLARLVATRSEDCGTCLQIEVNLARRAGLSDDVLRAVLRRSPEDLPTQLGQVYRFTQAMVRAGEEEEGLREAIVRAYGEEGLVELALAIAACRAFPITERVLGHAVSCQDVVIR
jgi:alkylhydroperoxidase family enzyme